MRDTGYGGRDAGYGMLGSLGDLEFRMEVELPRFVHAILKDDRRIGIQSGP